MKNPTERKYTWDLETILEGKSLDYLYNQWLNKQKDILKLYPTFLSNLKNFKK
jgi:oligoendopeptidase F